MTLIHIKWFAYTMTNSISNHSKSPHQSKNATYSILYIHSICFFLFCFFFAFQDGNGNQKAREQSIETLHDLIWIDTSYIQYV